MAFDPCMALDVCSLPQQWAGDGKLQFGLPGLQASSLSSAQVFVCFGSKRKQQQQQPPNRAQARQKPLCLLWALDSNRNEHV